MKCLCCGKDWDSAWCLNAECRMMARLVLDGCDDGVGTMAAGWLDKALQVARRISPIEGKVAEIVRGVRGHNAAPSLPVCGGCGISFRPEMIGQVRCMACRMVDSRPKPEAKEVRCVRCRGLFIPEKDGSLKIVCAKCVKPKKNKTKEVVEMAGRMMRKKSPGEKTEAMPGNDAAAGTPAGSAAAEEIPQDLQGAVHCSKCQALFVPDKKTRRRCESCRSVKVREEEEAAEAEESTLVDVTTTVRSHEDLKSIREGLSRMIPEQHSSRILVVRLLVQERRDHEA